MKIKSFFFGVLLILLGCSNHSIMYHQLLCIDSLLTNEQSDSALSLVRKIDSSKMQGEELAYYHLLRQQSEYKTYQHITSDSVISLVIDYYSHHKNRSKLARSYFYRACVRYDIKKGKEALDDLQRAKEIIKATKGNEVLRHNIHFLIASINVSYHEYQLALKNSKLALNYSLKTQKTNHLAYDYAQLSSIFYNLGNKDSSFCYFDKSISIVNEIPEKPTELRATIYGNLGISCYKIYPARAKELLEKSISLKPSANVYDALARLYLHNGDTIKARILLLKGIELNDKPDYNVTIFKELGKIEQETGDYKEANEWMRKAQELKDSLTCQQREDNIRAQQMAFDDAVEQERTENMLMYALIAIGVVALGSIAVFWYLRRRTASDRQNLKATTRQLRSTNKKLDRLEKKRKEEKKERRSLEKTFENGHKLYTELLSGGNILLWKRKEINEVVTYYRHVNPKFDAHVNTEYKHLTPNEKLYLCLLHIGKTEVEIKHTMNLRDSAFQTMKSRLNRSKNKTLGSLSDAPSEAATGESASAASP